MKHKKIIKIWYNQDELIESEEFKAIFKPYYKPDVDRKIDTYRKSDFIAAYMVEEEKHLDHFDRGYAIYRRYYTSDGVAVLKKVEASTTISNAPWQHVNIVEYIPEGFKDQTDLEAGIYWTGDYYKRDRQARAFIADSGLVMTLSN